MKVVEVVAFLHEFDTFWAEDAVFRHDKLWSRHNCRLEVADGILPPLSGVIGVVRKCGGE